MKKDNLKAHSDLKLLQHSLSGLVVVENSKSVCSPLSLQQNILLFTRYCLFMCYCLFVIVIIIIRIIIIIMFFIIIINLHFIITLLKLDKYE